MLSTRHLLTISLFATTLAGCASDGSGPFSTGSVTPSVADTPRTDPACPTLAAQIDALKKEGSIERLEKVAAGKTSTVSVQRAAIAKQAELNKANAEFQSKCAIQARSGIPAAAPAATAAPAVVPSAEKPTAAAKAVTKSAAAAPQSGVTVAAPATVKQ